MELGAIGLALSEGLTRRRMELSRACSTLHESGSYLVKFLVMIGWPRNVWIMFKSAAQA
jgi:hypothetical protein